MTQVDGLDVLLAWAMFLVLFGVVLFFVLRTRIDPIDEMKKHTRVTPPYASPPAARPGEPYGGRARDDG